MKQKSKIISIIIKIAIAASFIVLLITFVNHRFIKKHEAINGCFTFDYEQAYLKGAGSSKTQVTREYIQLQDTYRDLLCEYLNSKLSLDLLNDELRANGFNTKYEFKYDHMESGIHKYFKDKSTLDSDYVYLRNMIFLEHLSKEDIELLKENKATIKMITRTYQNVIDQYYNKERKGYVCYLDSFTPMRTTSFDIVLFYDYNREDENDPERLELLNGILAKYEVIFSEELGHPVVIINIMDLEQLEIPNI